MKAKFIRALLLSSIAMCPFKLIGAEDAARDASEFERSIVNLSATRAIPDVEAPWTTQNIDVSGFVGVLIGEDRVLAPASVVSRAVFIQAQKMEEVTKIPMHVVFVDYEANLAILEPAEGHLQGMKPLQLGDDVPLNTDMWMVGIENDRQLLRANVRVLELGMREVIPGGQQMLSYILTGQSRPQCKGEPLIRGGKLVGMCLGAVENQPWAHTSTTLKHFVQDHLDDKNYRGFPILGLNLSVVKSPHQKKDLLWPEGAKGLRVSSVHETSAFADDVKVDDVVVGLDQQRIDNRGFIRHPIWGPVPLRHYIAQRYAGDRVTLHLFRKGKPLEISRPLRRFNGQDYRLPGMTFEGPMNHLVIGGLVFRELSVDFLTSFGRDWAKSAPTDFLYLYQYMNEPILARKRYILMTHVLGDAFNQGYDKESLLLLEKVNGIEVANLDELRLTARARAVDRINEKFMVFEFQQGVQIVLPVNGLESAHKRIAKAYNIATPASFL